MESWITIAPIIGKEGNGKPLIPFGLLNFSSPFKFDKFLSIARTPDYIKNDSNICDLSTIQKERIKKSDFSFIAQYSSNEDKDKKADYFKMFLERIELAYLSLWLSKPTPIYYKDLFKFKNGCLFEASRLTQKIITSNEENNQHDNNSLGLAKQLYEKISAINRSGSVWLAARSIL